MNKKIYTKKKCTYRPPPTRANSAAQTPAASRPFQAPLNPQLHVQRLCPGFTPKLVLRPCKHIVVLRPRYVCARVSPLFSFSEALALLLYFGLASSRTEEQALESLGCDVTGDNQPLEKQWFVQGALVSPGLVSYPTRCGWSPVIRRAVKLRNCVP